MNIIVRNITEDPCTWPPENYPVLVGDYENGWDRVMSRCGTRFEHNTGTPPVTTYAFWADIPVPVRDDWNGGL